MPTDSINWSERPVTLWGWSWTLCQQCQTGGCCSKGRAILQHVSHPLHNALEHSPQRSAVWWRPWSGWSSPIFTLWWVLLWAHSSLHFNLASEWTTPSSSSWIDHFLTWRKPGSTVRIMFFDFSSAFNTIQPTPLGHKLELTGVNQHLTTWILDYHSMWGFGTVCWAQLSAVQGPNREQSWPLSCSPGTLKTYPTNYFTAFCKSSNQLC